MKDQEERQGEGVRFVQTIIDIDTLEERQVEQEEWRRLMTSRVPRTVTVDKAGKLLPFGLHFPYSRASAAVAAWRKRRQEEESNNDR